MSFFTQRLRLQWLAKNGYTGPRTRGGMGVVTPMATQQRPADSSPRVNTPTSAQVPAVRPEKPVSFVHK
jgi:hypothetical protein